MSLGDKTAQYGSRNTTRAASTVRPRGRADPGRLGRPSVADRAHRLDLCARSRSPNPSSTCCSSSPTLPMNRLYVPALEARGYVLRIREPDWHEHRLFKGPDININLHVTFRGIGGGPAGTSFPGPVAHAPRRPGPLRPNEASPGEPELEGTCKITRTRSPKWSKRSLSGRWDRRPPSKREHRITAPSVSPAFPGCRNARTRHSTNGPSCRRTLPPRTTWNRIGRGSSEWGGRPLPSL